MTKLELIEKGFDVDYCKNGVYFRSEKDDETGYLIELCEGKFEGNAIVQIYTIDHNSQYFDFENTISGNDICYPEYECEWIAELNLCGKYFFPKFNNDLQLYYPGAKYYGIEIMTR